MICNVLTMIAAGNKTTFANYVLNNNYYYEQRSHFKIY
jgi:hypothetical protein